MNDNDAEPYTQEQFTRDLDRYKQARIAKLNAITCPWALLSEFAFNPSVAYQSRHDQYPHVLYLVARAPEAEQDALLYAGKKIFHVRVSVMRKDLAWSKLFDRLMSGKTSGLESRESRSKN